MYYISYIDCIIVIFRIGASLFYTIVIDVTLAHQVQHAKKKNFALSTLLQSINHHFAIISDMFIHRENVFTSNHTDAKYDGALEFKVFDASENHSAVLTASVILFSLHAGNDGIGHSSVNQAVGRNIKFCNGMSYL